MLLCKLLESLENIFNVESVDRTSQVLHTPSRDTNTVLTLEETPGTLRRRENGESCPSYCNPRYGPAI